MLVPRIFVEKYEKVGKNVKNLKDKVLTDRKSPIWSASFYIFFTIILSACLVLRNQNRFVKIWDPSSNSKWRDIDKSYLHSQTNFPNFKTLNP